MGDIAQILGIQQPPSVSTSPSAVIRNHHHHASVIDTKQNATTTLPRAVKLQQLPKEVLQLLAGNGGSSNTTTSKNHDNHHHHQQQQHLNVSMELPMMVPTKTMSGYHKNKKNSMKRNDTGIETITPNNKTTTTTSGNDTTVVNDIVVKVGNQWISSMKPARSWVYTNFTSSARDDGLQLYHWVRNHIEYIDYPYARFNIHIDPIIFDTTTQQLYDTIVTSNSSSASIDIDHHHWSKSETDILFDLVRQYELRWPIIYDRWIEIFGYHITHHRNTTTPSTSKDDTTISSSSSTTNGTTIPKNNHVEPPFRKIEDLQYRYYSITTILLQHQISNEAAIEAQSLHASTIQQQQQSMATSPSTNAPHNTTSHTTGTTTNTTTTTTTMIDDNSKQRDVEALVIETAAARALATTDKKYQPFIQNIGTGTSNKLLFDINQERERRHNMELLWNRTKSDEIEEYELRKELKSIEAQLRKLKKSGIHIAAAAAATAAVATNSGTSNTNLSSSSTGNPLMSTTSSRATTPIQFNTNSTTSTSQHHMTLDVAQAATLNMVDHVFTGMAPIAVPGTPYLQSCRLDPPPVGGNTGINKALLQRMQDVLTELGVSTDPIPTKRVCDLYDTVRKDIITLLILQKEVLKMEGIVASKRLRLAKKIGKVNNDDEEALLGIYPPKPPVPVSKPVPTTTGKGSRATKTDGTGKKRSNTPKSGVTGISKATSAGGDTKKDGSSMMKQSASSTTAGTKQPRKPSATGTKRKRKVDDTGPKSNEHTTKVSNTVATTSTSATSLTIPQVTTTTTSTTDTNGLPTAGIAPVSDIVGSTSTVAAMSVLPTDAKQPSKKRAKKNAST